MINCRPVLHLRHLPPICRSNHNLISFLKTSAVKNARVTKSTQHKNDELNNLISLLKNPKSAVKNERANKSVLDANDEGLRKLTKEFHLVAKINTKWSHRLYLINEKTAAKIAQHLTESVDQRKTFVETNPGPGLLTNLLVESGMTDLRLFENQQYFLTLLQEMYTRVHPDRVKVVHADLITLQRTMYIDHLNSSRRTDEILSHLPSTEWQNDINFTLFGATGSSNFLRQLIHSIVFRNGIMGLGRCQLYMVMPSMTYLTLTSSNASMSTHYRYFSVLFQICFEYQLLDKFPRAHFLPNISSSKAVVKSEGRRRFRHAKGIKFSLVDPESMYFVKIVPRRDLYEWLPSNQIQELWHFVQLICQSRLNRIILLLENMLPGCGARLMLNYETKEAVRPQRIHEVDLCETPPTTNPSMTLSDRDYVNLNIFTLAGDLQPSQLLTLFREFRMLPEYSTCNFLPSLESALLKRCGKSDNSSACTKQASDEETRNHNSVVK